MARVQYETTPVPKEVQAQVNADPRAARFASGSQVQYIRSLVDQKDISSLADSQQVFLNEESGEVPFEHMSMLQASKIIDVLKPLPSKFSGRVPTVTQTSGHEAHSPGMDSLVKVPQGRYAVEEDGVLKFFHVDRPTEGRWAGYTFIKIRASDELYRVKDRARCANILKLIEEAGIKEATEKYGQELGSCGICGRTLTDPLSREIGIGPVCRGRSEWY